MIGDIPQKARPSCVGVSPFLYRERRDSMKKRLLMPILILALVFVVLLNGCKKEEPVDEPTPTPLPANGKVEEVEDDEKAVIMDEFREIAEENDPLLIKEYVDENVGKLSQLEGNLMIDSLEKSLIDNLDEVTNRLTTLDEDGELMDIASDEFFFSVDKVSQIKNGDLKKEVSTLLDSNYKLINLEGSFYPIVDYEALQGYNNNVTDEWKEYLAVRAMDSNNPPFADGALRISFDDLANRIIKTENYLNKYLDSSRREEMKDSYHNKIAIYLKGVDNTPIADSGTKEIYEDILGSYNSTSHQEGYITANILYRYVEAIKANNNIIDDKILQLADDLISEAVEILTEFK